MDSLKDAQRDMNDAYFYGVPGIVSSGVVWLLAGLVGLLYSPVAGIVTLIFGGTLIFPVSVLLCKLCGRSGKHHESNPLASLAIEGTFWMLLSIPVAVGVSMYQVALFFPAMLLIIAGRYLTFNTLYGARIFWLFGGGLFALACALVFLSVPAYLGGIFGGAMELFFALIIFSKTRWKSDSQT